MNGVSLEFANIPTPLPSSSSQWINSSEKVRIDLVKSVVKDFSGIEKIDIRSAFLSSW